MRGALAGLGAAVVIVALRWQILVGAIWGAARGTQVDAEFILTVEVAGTLVSSTEFTASEDIPADLRRRRL